MKHTGMLAMVVAIAGAAAILCVVMAATAIIGRAAAQYITARDLQAAPSALRTGYVMGFSDGLAAAELRERYGHTVDIFVNCLAGKSIGEVQAMLEAHLANYPEQLDSRTGVVMIEMMGRRCLK